MKLPIKQIKPYWRNPRDNTKTIEALKESIKKFGFKVPITVDKKHVIVTGHARYKAMIELGYEEIECVMLDLPAGKVKEYRLADNKVAEFSLWDSDKLSVELAKLSDPSVMQDFGFQSAELEDLAVIPVPELNSEAWEAGPKNTVGGKGEENDDNELILTCPECFHEHRYTKRDLLALRGTGEGISTAD